MSSPDGRYLSRTQVDAALLKLASSRSDMANIEKYARFFCGNRREDAESLINRALDRARRTNSWPSNQPYIKTFYWLLKSEASNARRNGTLPSLNVTIEEFIEESPPADYDGWPTPLSLIEDKEFYQNVVSLSRTLSPRSAIELTLFVYRLLGDEKDVICDRLSIEIDEYERMNRYFRLMLNRHEPTLASGILKPGRRGKP